MNIGSNLKVSETGGIKMESHEGNQFVTNAKGNRVAVLVPIQLWHEIESERETARLLGKLVMRQRLLEAKERTTGISVEDARVRLGI